MRKLTTGASAAALLTLTLAAAAADTWKESFTGGGSGDSRESGCMSAENMARSNAAAACMTRMGHRVDEAVGSCSCSSAFDGKVNTCQTTIKITCEKAGR
jgi:hypothetical protein